MQILSVMQLIAGGIILAPYAVADGDTTTCMTISTLCDFGGPYSTYSSCSESLDSRLSSCSSSSDLACLCSGVTSGLRCVRS